jgi:predicted nucleic acid-binding protein
MAGLVIPTPHTFLLDAHALTLYADDARAMQSWLALAQGTDSSFCISAVTLAETTDGSPRDANVRRAVKGMECVEVSEAIGYGAGRLRTKAANLRDKSRDLTVDALIAATALSLYPPVVVLTSDTPDMELLLEGTGVRVHKIG